MYSQSGKEFHAAGPAQEKACHDRATFTDVYLFLVLKIDIRGHIAGCKNSIRHIENCFSPYFILFVYNAV